MKELLMPQIFQLICDKKYLICPGTGDNLPHCMNFVSDRGRIRSYLRHVQTLILELGI